MPTKDSTKKRRSRNGCQECRRSHRKCDIAQPTCTGCRIGKKKCSYVQELSWGGRSFAKSRFSECLVDGGVVQVEALSHDSESFLRIVTHGTYFSCMKNRSWERAICLWSVRFLRSPATTTRSEACQVCTGNVQPCPGRKSLSNMREKPERT